MIEITFREFFDYRYSTEEFHELYIMKNRHEEILYIGISNQNIWNRWFGLSGHISVLPNRMIGESAVGRKIVDYLPNSWNWKIQLWTIDDCIVYCADELNPQGRYTIQLLEPIMIRKLCPILNITYNLYPGTDSMSRSENEIKRDAELDKAYRKVFEKKD